MYLANAPSDEKYLDDENAQKGHKSVKIQKHETCSRKDTADFENVDQIGNDQDKILYNISTQALSLLILLGIISGMIVNLYVS